MNHWILVVMTVLSLTVLGSVFFFHQSLWWLSLSFLRRLNQWTGRVFDLINRDWNYKFLVKVGNRYFLKGFTGTPYHQRLIFFPLRLVAWMSRTGSPILGYALPERLSGLSTGSGTKGSAETGICSGICCTQLLLLTPDLLPSDLFIKEKLNYHGARALLGVTCCWDPKNQAVFRRYSFEKEGYVSERSGAGYVLQGILLSQRKCSNATVDWEMVKDRLRLKA